MTWPEITQKQTKQNKTFTGPQHLETDNVWEKIGNDVGSLTPEVESFL